jgi:hypothetical protein
MLSFLSWPLLGKDLKRFSEGDENVSLSEWPRRLRRRRWLFRGVIAAVVIVVLLVLMFGCLSIWPGMGAKGAEAMRGVIGDRATAALEGFLLSLQDSLHRAEYAVGIGHKGDPFASQVADSSTSTTTSGPTATSAADGGETSGGQTDRSGSTAATTSTTEAPWVPPPVPPLGSLPDEGKWSSYLTDPTGRTVGYRTALQPDSQRGFALARIHR